MKKPTKKEMRRLQLQQLDAFRLASVNAYEKIPAPDLLCGIADHLANESTDETSFTLLYAAASLIAYLAPFESLVTQGAKPETAHAALREVGKLPKGVPA